MFTYRIPLFKLCGFSVNIDLSWFLIAILIVWSLAGSLFPLWYEGLSPASYLWMGVGGALGLFLSIVLHEFGHAMAARQFGIEMKGITLFIFGGVAEMRDEPPSAKAEFVVAVAGPVVSVLIAAATAAGGLIGQSLGAPVPVTGVLLYLGAINTILVVFNAIPAFPLDGGRVLRSILWYVRGDLKWATRITSSLGSGFGVALIVLGVVSFITGNFIGGMWWCLLGFFLRGAAQMSYQQLIIRRALEGEPVSRFMKTEVETVSPTTTIQQLVDDYVYRHHFKMFPVTENGHVTGCVRTSRICEVPREEWPHHAVSEIAEACSEKNTISCGADATDVLARMHRQHVSRLMVLEGGDRLRGVISLKDMMRFISTKVELEGG